MSTDGARLDHRSYREKLQCRQGQISVMLHDFMSIKMSGTGIYF